MARQQLRYCVAIVGEHGIADLFDHDLVHASD